MARLLMLLLLNGLRTSLYEEFNHLYVFNLRGDARTSGTQRQKEKGNIFGVGSRNPIAISILVKDDTEKHELYYHDIGDYLSQKDKLDIIKEFGDISKITWEKIKPDEFNDWLNQRDVNYSNYKSLADENNSYFSIKDSGIATHRDSWVNNFSKADVVRNVQRMIEVYNSDVRKLSQIDNEYDSKDVIKYLTTDDSKISWSTDLIKKANRQEIIEFNEDLIVEITYRPFVKKYVYRSKELNYTTYKSFRTLPDKNSKNLFINIAGISSKSDFSTLMTDTVNDYMIFTNSRNFPRYIYEEGGLFEERVDNVISDDEFFYIYAVLHSPRYRENYQNDLKKSLPRIPQLKNKDKYIEIGRKLSSLHLNYEEVPVYDDVEIQLSAQPSYKVSKMKFIKKGDRSAIVYNNDITIRNIPEKAYEYMVNGRSAIEWIMDQYQVKTDKKSGITDDPNDYSTDEKYIFNLLLRIINVSMQTVDLINSLPKFEVEE